MIFLWLPYLHLDWDAVGAKVLAIGGVELHEDTDDVWPRVFGIDRPRFLQIFRKFPTMVKGREASPA